MKLIYCDAEWIMVQVSISVLNMKEINLHQKKKRGKRKKKQLDKELPHPNPLWRKLSTEKLMLLNCGVGEDSRESLGLQGDPTSPS